MSDIAFTESVKAVQSRRGSRAAYAKLEAKGGFPTKITADLIKFLVEVDTVYLATANASGQPCGSRIEANTEWPARYDRS